MGTSDGMVLGEPICLLPGPGAPPGVTNVLVLGDGYPFSFFGTPFATHSSLLVSRVKAEPWYKSSLGLNVYRQHVVSSQTGADIEHGCARPRTVATYFDASFGGGGLCRLLTGNDALVWTTATDAAAKVLGQNAEFDAVIVMVNSDLYGGSQSKKIAWVSAWPGFPDVALHELGHVAGLSDEYGYYEACNDDHNRWVSSTNQAFPNVDHSGTNPKWLAEVTLTSLPSLVHPPAARCAQCFDPPDAVLIPFGDDVGTFESSGWWHCGLYRPTAHCKMRKLKDPFCKICQEQLVAWLT